jgi:hypothetical protein
VRVFDSDYPANYDEDVLLIDVTRNPSRPTILDIGNLQAEIWDTHPTGAFILDVNATDTDGVSVPLF